MQQWRKRRGRSQGASHARFDHKRLPFASQAALADAFACAEERGEEIAQPAAKKGEARAAIQVEYT